MDDGTWLAKKQNSAGHFHCVCCSRACAAPGASIRAVNEAKYLCQPETAADFAAISIHAAVQWNPALDRWGNCVGSSGVI